jgi:hypothetical protein
LPYEPARALPILDGRNIIEKYPDMLGCYNYLNRVGINGDINECNRYVKHCNDIVAPRIDAGTFKSQGRIDARVGAWLSGGGSG